MSYRGHDPAAFEPIIIAHCEWADRRLAKRCGVHRQTIRKARARLVAAGQIPDVDTVYRGDGSRYPARPRPPEPPRRGR